MWISRFKHFRLTKQLWLTVLYILIVAHTVYTIRKCKFTEFCGRQRQCQRGVWGVLPSGKMSVFYNGVINTTGLTCDGKRKEFSFLWWKFQHWLLTAALRRWHSNFSQFSIQLCVPCWLNYTTSGKIGSCQTRLGQKHCDAIKSHSFSCLLLLLILLRCYKGNLHATVSGDNTGELMFWREQSGKPRIFVKTLWIMDDQNVFKHCRINTNHSRFGITHRNIWTRQTERSALLCLTGNVGVSTLNNVSKATRDLLWPVTRLLIIFPMSSSYGLPKEEAQSYVLCDTIGSTGNHQWRPEGFRVVGDNERPLLLQSLWKPREGLARRFEIQRKSWVEERTSKDKDTITAGTVSACSTVSALETDRPHPNSVRLGINAFFFKNCNKAVTIKSRFTVPTTKNVVCWHTFFPVKISQTTQTKLYFNGSETFLPLLCS